MSRALGDHFPKNEKAGLIGEPFISELIRIDSDTRWLVLASDGVGDGGRERGGNRGKREEQGDLFVHIFWRPLNFLF